MKKTIQILLFIFCVSVSAQQKAVSVIQSQLPLVNHPADPTAIEMMQERGLDLGPHRAQQASVALCRWAELVLVMEGHHRDALGDIDPTVRGKTFLLGHWQKQEVPDPYKRSRAVWDESVKLIDEGVAAWLKRL